MDVEMPTVETIRKMVQRNEGVAFLPRMCVEQEIEKRGGLPPHVLFFSKPVNLERLKGFLDAHVQMLRQKS